jgi:hypothetical protein
MIMKEEDYFIAGLHIDNDKNLVVFSRFLSYSKDWPSILTYKDKEYQFNGKEPLPDAYVGHYFSMALYSEV